MEFNYKDERNHEGAILSNSLKEALYMKECGPDVCQILLSDSIGFTTGFA